VRTIRATRSRRTDMNRYQRISCRWRRSRHQTRASGKPRRYAVRQAASRIVEGRACSRSGMGRPLPTFTCLCPSEAQTTLLCRDRRGPLPGTCTERQITAMNSGRCRSQHNRRDHSGRHRVSAGSNQQRVFWRFAAARGRLGRTAMKYPASGNLYRAQSSANVRQKRGFDDAPRFTALRAAIASA
jgi:hypothetical protein